ncbi:hypothetical protein ABIE44_000226 [Marmoricola sp. OAE513]|uniref:DUF4192 domain-containing protein n=1 Tax=Marmoricola sp. OAE513 TaxID=2817894 RepID=UPI001AE1839C
MDTYTARTPVDLLALVPIVIGFHPEDSVVMLTFGAPGPTEGRSSFQARVDLPVVEHEQRAVAGMLREVARRHEVPRVALVLYTDDDAAASSFADLLVPGLIHDDVTVVDVLRVDGEHFFRVGNQDDPGTPFDLGSHPLTAAGVLRGRVVMESREALADTLVSLDTNDTAAIEKAANDFTDELLASGTTGESVTEVIGAHARWLQEVLAELADSRSPVTADEAGKLLILLSFDALREVAWSQLHRQNAEGYVELLRGLLRRAPEELRPGVGGLLGLAAWLAGDGALAWCALDRCLAVDPEDKLAEHVVALLESAVPPAVWAPVPAEELPLFRSLAARGSAAS